jgi:hypothetical protein
MAEYKINIYCENASETTCQFDFNIMEKGAYKVYTTYSGGQADYKDPYDSNIILNTNLFDGVFYIPNDETSQTTYQYAIPLTSPTPINTLTRYGSVIYDEPHPIYINNPPSNSKFTIVLNNVFKKTESQFRISSVKGLLSLRFVKI